MATLSTVAAAPPVPCATGWVVCRYVCAPAAAGMASAAPTPSSASRFRLVIEVPPVLDEALTRRSGSAGTRRMSACGAAPLIVRSRVT